MSFKLPAVNERGEPTPLTVDKLPHECPVCHNAVKPEPLAGRYVTDGNHRIRVAFWCPVEGCQEVFIGAYHCNSSNVAGNISSLQKTHALRVAESIVFPEDVQKISPLFCQTYNQSHTAEINALDQIAGPGYRKSLEFLIKDFLVSYKFKDDPGAADKVRGMFLGRCISELIDEDRIKQCASRAAWLGNDETHYTRKWGQKDITDLKVLVNMTVSWIDLVMQSDSYLQSMPEDGKRSEPPPA